MRIFLLGSRSLVSGWSRWVTLCVMPVLACFSSNPEVRKSTSADTTSIRQSVRSAPLAARQTDSVASGPSLSETISWLSNDALAMMTLTEIGTDRSSRMLVTTKHKVSSLTVKDCALSWTTRISFTISSPAGTTSDPGKPFTDTVSLKTVDVGGISVVQMPPSQRSDEPTQRILIPLRGKEGPPEGMDVRNKVDGERVANALRRAATLCGATAQPF